MSDTSAVYRLQYHKNTQPSPIVLAYLGEGLLVVVFELQGVDIELVLVGGERVVVLGLFREKLLDLHWHPLAAVLEGLDWDVGGSHRVLTKEHTSYGTKALRFLLSTKATSSSNTACKEWLEILKVTESCSFKKVVYLTRFLHLNPKDYLSTILYETVEQQIATF